MSAMRWENLFSDLEGQLASAGELELESQVADLARAEAAGVGLAERLRGQGAAPVALLLRGGLRFRGHLAQVAATWLVLDSGPHSVLVPHEGIVTVEGLGRGAVGERSAVRRALSLGSGLRAIARDRSPVACFVDAGTGESLTVTGTLDTVGADYVEVAPLRAPDRGESRGLRAVPFGRLIAIRSGG
ncbi:hypothetical protein [Sinomonas soli]